MNSMLMELFGLPEIKQYALKHILLVLSEILFNGYFSILLGATIFALVYSSIARKSKNENLGQFAKDLFSLLYMSRWAGVLLTVGSLIAITLFKGFFLYESKSEAVGTYALAIILIGIGLAFSFSFQNFLTFSRLEEKLKENGNDAYLAGSPSSGWLSLFFLIIGAWAYSTASVEGANELLWGVKESVAFSTETFSQLLLMIALSLPMAAGAKLFMFFNDHRIQLAPEYASLVGQRANWILYTFSIAVPFVIMLRVLAIPDHAINVGTVILSVLAMATVYGIFHMARALKDGSTTRYDKVILPAFLLVVVLLTFALNGAASYGIRDHVEEVQKHIYHEKAKAHADDSHGAPLQLNRY